MKLANFRANLIALSLVGNIFVSSCSMHPYVLTSDLQTSLPTITATTPQFAGDLQQAIHDVDAQRSAYYDKLQNRTKQRNYLNGALIGLSAADLYNGVTSTVGASNRAVINFGAVAGGAYALGTRSDSPNTDLASPSTVSASLRNTSHAFRDIKPLDVEPAGTQKEENDKSLDETPKPPVTSKVADKSVAPTTSSSTMSTTATTESINISPEDSLSEAVALYRLASSRDLITSKVLFTLNTDPEKEDSAAYVVPNFKNRTCTAYVSPKALVAAGLMERNAFRFTVFHELAHCDLYMSPATINMLPGASAKANLLLSDLVQIEYLHASASKRLNGYNIYQKTYADIKAVAILRALGANDEAVSFVARFRQKNVAVMDTHDTHAAVVKASQHKWNGRHSNEIDAEVREMADAALVDTFLEKVFKVSSGHFVASDLLKGAMREPMSNLYFKYSEFSHRQFIQTRLDEVKLSKNPVWVEFSKLVSRHQSEEGVLVAYFAERYDVSADDMGSLDLQIARELEKVLRQENSIQPVALSRF